MDSNPIRAIDLFCGAGGSSLGAQKAGVEIVAGFDCWDLAQRTFKDNFPDAKFYGGKLENRRLKVLAKEIGPIALILASPECTNHTCAKGGGPRSETSRATALQVVRFARVFSPRWIIIENVIQMRNWKRYESWLAVLRRLGYNVAETILNATDFGVPQSRRRLFILCDKEKPVPKLRTRTARTRTIGEIVNLNGAYAYSPLRIPQRAKPTLERADRAIAALGERKKFLIVYYGSDGAGGWQSLKVPLRTITTLDRFALVKPSRKGHLMRMLQVPELKRAMGFDSRFKLYHGARRDRIKLLGNAVCPPVMKALVRHLTRASHTTISIRDSLSSNGHHSNGKSFEPVHVAAGV